MSDRQKPKIGVVYRQTSTGHMYRFNGEYKPSEEFRDPALEFYRGWSALGPDVIGKLLGEPWGWPHGYEEVSDE
jgi:hypothetical protein